MIGFLKGLALPIMPLQPLKASIVSTGKPDVCACTKPERSLSGTMAFHKPVQAIQGKLKNYDCSISPTCSTVVKRAALESVCADYWMTDSASDKSKLLLMQPNIVLFCESARSGNRWRLSCC